MLHTMKNKSILLLTIFSVLACGIHALVLNTEYTNYAFTSALKVILFLLFPLMYFAVSKDGKFKDMFSKLDKKKIKLPFVLGGIVFTFIVVAFMILSPFIDRAMIVNAFAKNGIVKSNFLLVFIYVVLINAALEELFFRGFVFTTLYKSNFKRYAHVYSSLLFAFYHVSILNGALSPVMFVLCIFGLIIAGLIFNALTVKCKSIMGSLIVHISANLAINVMVAIKYL